VQLISRLAVGLIAVFWAYDGWCTHLGRGEVERSAPKRATGHGIRVLAVGVIYLA